MDQQSDKKRVIISGIVAVAILVVLVGGVMALKAKENNKQVADSQLTADSQETTNDTSDSSGSNDNNASQTTQTTAVPTDYKDGTYTASGSYTTPESTEEITVTVTIDDDVVTDVSVTGQPQAPESRDYQQQFLSGYKSLVIGKDVDTISLSRVSGSSLTSRGFNNAIKQIKNQAHS